MTTNNTPVPVASNQKFKTNAPGKTWLVLLCFSSIIVVVIGALTGMGAITALPVGILLGFFLHKGNLCPATAFSEWFLYGNGQKLFAVWIASVIAAMGFLLLTLMGEQIQPRDFYWLHSIIGGLIVGTASVIAGGGIGSCLFRAGTGNVPSLSVLIMVPIGYSLAITGPLQSLSQRWQHIHKATTLNSWGQWPSWLLPVIFGIPTLLLVFLRFRKKTFYHTPPGQTQKTMLNSMWKPWKAGIAIGILSFLIALSSHVAGYSSTLEMGQGIYHIHALFTGTNFHHVWGKSSPGDGKIILWWGLLLSPAVMIGAWISALITGRAKWTGAIRRVPASLLGGFFLGMGVAIAQNCLVGSMVSGWAVMSTGSLLFGFCAMTGNWTISYYYAVKGKINPLLPPKKYSSANIHRGFGKVQLAIAWCMIIVAAFMLNSTENFTPIQKEKPEGNFSEEFSEQSDFSAETNTNSTISLKYMGQWYKDLDRLLQRIEKVARRNVRYQTSGTGMKLDRATNTSRLMRKYPLDITRIAQTFFQEKSNKNFQKWVKERKSNAISQGQIRQVKILSQFEKQKKFHIDIENDLEELEDAIEELEEEADDGEIGEDNIRLIGQTLDKIDRNYREQKQDLDSAVANFQYWSK